MGKRIPQQPVYWVTNFSEKQFTPIVKAIGQSTLLWNDLHEFLGHLYCIAVGGPYDDVHLDVWYAVPNDRAKREMLLAAAKWTFIEKPSHTPRDERSTEQQQKSFDAINWLCVESQKLEDDRNNAIHAPLVMRYPAEVVPQTLYGNRRAKNLENKYLLPEYRRLRDTALSLRNYAATVREPMCNANYAWPDKPRLPDRGATKKPQPPRPTEPAKPPAPPQSLRR